MNAHLLETPWAIDEYGTVRDQNGNDVVVNGFGSVLSPGQRMDDAKARAALIVKAVNSYAPLIEEREEMVKALRGGETSLNAADRLRLHVEDPTTFEFCYDDASELCGMIDALLSRIGEERT